MRTQRNNKPTPETLEKKNKKGMSRLLFTSTSD